MISCSSSLRKSIFSTQENRPNLSQPHLPTFLRHRYVISAHTLALKEECQSDGDRARWAWEAHDKRGLGEQAFQPSFAALAKSASTCASCFLFHTCLPDPTSYALDENRPITIRAGLAKGKDEQRDISHLKVGLPVIDSNHPDETASIYGKVEIYANHGILVCPNRATF
jgi:hypothetical protein